MIHFTKSGLIAKPICAENINSFELYENCVEKENDFFNSTLPKWAKLPGSSSFDKFYLLDEYYVAHLVKPKDGLIKLNRTNTFGIGLDSNFEYVVGFYDWNFFLQTSNPDVVQKNMLMIKKNVYTFIYLKVNAFSELDIVVRRPHIKTFFYVGNQT